MAQPLVAWSLVTVIAGAEYRTTLYAASTRSISISSPLLTGWPFPKLRVHLPAEGRDAIS
jgi:hypothetical protein